MLLISIGSSAFSPSFSKEDAAAGGGCFVEKSRLVRCLQGFQGLWNKGRSCERSVNEISDIKYFEYGDDEINHLRMKDKKLGAAIDSIGIIKRRVNPDVFSSLIEGIIGQQISSKAAVTVCQKLDALCAMDSGRLHALTVEEIQSCGMSMRKADYVKGVANAVVNKELDINAFSDMSDSEVIESLTALKGIGVWTAEMLLIFSLNRPNVISFGDLAIRRGMMHLYGLKELPYERFMRYAKRYAPYASVASLYLWHISDPDFMKE